MTNGFDLGHDLDIWILKVICDLDHLVTKVRCKDLPDSDWGDFRCRRAIDSSSYLENESNSSDTFTCVGQLICLEGHVSSLNKSNPIQILIALVWEWALHTVYYNISSDLQRVHTPTLEIQSSYWPTHQSTARQFSVGTAGPTKIDASVGSPSSPDSFTLPSVFGRCEW